MPNKFDSAYTGAAPDFSYPGPARATDGILQRRVLAYMLDLACIGVISAVLFLPLMLLTLLSAFLIHFYALLGALPLAYATLLIGGPHGATWGMRMMNLAYRRTDGSRPSYLDAFMATLIFYVSVAATFWLILIVPLLSDRRRTLHDMACGLVMLRTDGESRIF